MYHRHESQHRQQKTMPRLWLEKTKKNKYISVHCDESGIWMKGLTKQPRDVRELVRMSKNAEWKRRLIRSGFRFSLFCECLCVCPTETTPFPQLSRWTVIRHFLVSRAQKRYPKCFRCTNRTLKIGKKRFASLSLWEIKHERIKWRNIAHRMPSGRYAKSVCSNVVKRSGEHWKIK